MPRGQRVGNGPLARRREADRPARGLRPRALGVLFAVSLQRRAARCALAAADEARAKKLFYEEYTGRIACAVGLGKYLGCLNMSLECGYEACIPTRCAARAAQFWGWGDVKLVLERLKHRAQAASEAAGVHRGELQQVYSWLCGGGGAAPTKAELQDAVDVFDVAFAGGKWQQLPDRIDASAFLDFFAPRAAPPLPPGPPPAAYKAFSSESFDVASEPATPGLPRVPRRASVCASVSEFADEDDIKRHCWGGAPAAARSASPEVGDVPAAQSFLARLEMLRRESAAREAPGSPHLLRWRALSDVVKTGQAQLIQEGPAPEAEQPPCRTPPRERKVSIHHAADLRRSFEQLLARTDPDEGRRRRGRRRSSLAHTPPEAGVLRHRTSSTLLTAEDWPLDCTPERTLSDLVAGPPPRRSASGSPAPLALDQQQQGAPLSLLPAVEPVPTPSQPPADDAGRARPWKPPSGRPRIPCPDAVPSPRTRAARRRRIFANTTSSSLLLKDQHPFRLGAGLTLFRPRKQPPPRPRPPPDTIRPNLSPMRGLHAVAARRCSGAPQPPQDAPSPGPRARHRQQAAALPLAP
eukprot:TRINITY_DN3833_c0_g1_i1.p1 TRINITY_DN3833_c0_g1~~TRINITY_DN3833_c0_g1_i1.p1  ORF type:complete len:580 (+),score=153.84 TRINITY_DN3833_c0_g1_i1:53-1792(+)